MHPVLHALRESLRDFLRPGPRLVDELACVASVMLAIAIAHAIGARMVAWAAFSAFVLMKGEPGETLLRGVLRIIGTMLGAALALLAVPLATSTLAGAMLAAGGVGALGLYGMLTARRAYAWLLFGLTFEMILLDKLEHPVVDTFALARTRLLEVGAGTIACVLVSVSVALALRKGGITTLPPPPPRMHWHPGAARHAAQAGLALALVPLVHALVPLPELAQAGVTIMAVMIVPVAGIGASGLVPVSRRLLHRALGCLAGGTLASAVLLLAGGSAPLLIAGTCLGILVGRHIENAGTRVSYIGLQFTLAVLVVLVPDSYAAAAIRPGLQRLVSIFVGMALLEPVLLAWHAFAPRGPRVEAADAGGE